MSLFGNLGGGSASQPTSNAGAPATSSSTAFTPLFGKAPTSTSAPSSGLFGSLGATPASSHPASSGGLGGLFGASNATTTAPAASSSAPAFSFPTVSSQPQASNPPKLGLFSTSTSQPAQQTTVTNPLSNPAQTGAGGQASMFSASSAPQQPGGPLSQPNGGTGKSAHFDHLLERSRKRNAGENGLGSFDELPTLQLGLGDIARKVRNLGAGGPSADQAQDRAA